MVAIPSASAAAGTVTQFSLPARYPDAVPVSVAAGPDGNVWFTMAAPSMIGRITPSGSVNVFSPPARAGAPGSLIAGPDGAVWFMASQMGRISDTGKIAVFAIPAGTYVDAGKEALAVGSDGAVWFTERTLHRIGRLTTDGAYTGYPLPLADWQPYDITAGPDDALWFTDFDRSRIGRMTTSGTATTYDLPADSFPGWIITGPDGNLWFTRDGGIGRITPSGSVLSTIPMPAGGVGGLALGADGNVWASGGEGNVYRVTPDGVVTTFASTALWGGPITAAADGNVWLAESGDNKLGRAEVAPKPIPTLTLAASKTTVSYRGTVRLRAHLSGHGANSRVAIYRTPAGGTQRLVASGALDQDGNFTTSVALVTTNTFVATYTGDSTFAPARSDAARVSVRAQVSGVLSGGYAVRNGYRLYRYHASCPSSRRGCVPYTATVRPNKPGGCVYFRGQAHISGAWRAQFHSSCVRLGARSHAKILIWYRRAVIDHALRVRAEFRGDQANAANIGGWSYFKVTR